MILESNTLQNMLATHLPLEFCLRKLKCHGKTAVVSYTNQLVASFFKYHIYLANFFMTLDFSNSRGFFRSCKFSLMNVLQNCWFQRSCRWKKYKYYKNICHFIRHRSCNNFYTNYIELVSQKVTCKSNKTFV